MTEHTVITLIMLKKMRGLPETENIWISSHTPHCLRIKHNTNQVLNPSKAELNSNLHLHKNKNGFGKKTEEQTRSKRGLKNVRPWKLETRRGTMGQEYGVGKKKISYTTSDRST